jgi:RNA polymerase sigma factor (TIGR02999 family)
VSGEVTGWLARWREGDREALDRLLPLVYDELRRVAHLALRRERPGHTLATNDLVHEAYLKLLKERALSAADRGEFLAVASRTMRRLLVDSARARRRRKRGGGEAPLPLDELEIPLSDAQADELLIVDEALDRLAGANPRASEIVLLRWFGGLTLEETAQALALSTKTVQRDWLTARAWLRKELAVELS